MNRDIDEALLRLGGVANRAQLLRVTSRGRLDHEVASGRLTCIYPRTYCRPWDADLARIREHAAVLSVGQPAGLGHLSALGRWELPCPDSQRVHVAVPARRHPFRLTPGIEIHRMRRFPPVVRLDGVITFTPAAAIVSSWPLLAGPDQRAPILTGYREGLVTVSELDEALSRAPTLAGRRSLAELVQLLREGCESELERWGYLKVFSVRGLNHADRQRWLRVDGRRYRGDMAYEEERLLVELDGRKYHSSTEQWERDIARDLALAKIGWQTIRLSHYRLTNDVEGCRRDVLAVLAERRAWRRSR